MYDKYYLSKDQLKTLQTWSESNLPLFIYGPPGIGKTTLAKELLKNKVITVIDTLNLKNNVNLYDYILNIIGKKNITLMFNHSKTTNRGLILDNIDVFNKYDKKNFKSIIRFLNEGKLYGTQLIVICNLKFISHRSINKINFIRFKLDYDKHLIHKIATSILKEKKINLSFDQRNRLLIKSNYNLNSFVSILNDDQQINTSPMDNFDNSEKLYQRLFEEEYTMSEIIRLYEPEKITISLNLLENIYDYITDINIISSIFQNYEIADIFDKQAINYTTISFYSIMTTYYVYLFIKKKTMNKLRFKNNKYISRCLILVSSEKKYENYSEDNYLISMYLFMIYKNIYPEEIISKLKRIDPKILDHSIKMFQYFYECNIQKKVLKLLH
tara:strand:- start:27 stop:1178 length:1152 start_codon:yes stop_codon:yes gene_type:complete